MALMTAGYWPATYWPDTYWPDDYWQDYGVPYSGLAIVAFSSKKAGVSYAELLPEAAFSEKAPTVTFS